MGLEALYKIVKKIAEAGLIFIIPSLLTAQYIDTNWTVIGYFGELWFAEEENILGKQQEFSKGWADGVFYSLSLIHISEPTRPY